MDKKILTFLFCVIIGIECIGTLGGIGYRILQKAGIFEDTVDDRFMVKPYANLFSIDDLKEQNSLEEVAETDEEYETKSNILTQMQSVYDKIDSKANSIIEYLDFTFDQHLVLKYQYIELFGLSQNLLHRTYILDADSENNIIKLSDGKIMNAKDRESIASLQKKAETYNEINNYCKKNQKKFLVVLAPYKIGPNDERLIRGIKDFSNDNADDFIELLRGYGIDCLDLRQEAINDHMSWSDMFYDTDHHWNSDTSFWAYTKIAAYMTNNYGTNFRNETVDESNYDAEVLENVWLGSRGRRVGESYAGIDDYKLITPKFEVKQEVFVDSLTPWVFEGNYQDTIIDKQTLEKVKAGNYNKYTTDIYATCAYGNSIRSVIKNELKSNGETIYIGRDSFGETVAPYFGFSFENTIIDFDNLNFLRNDPITTEIKYVVYIYNIGNVK